MAYGLKYFGEFDENKIPMVSVYRLEILQNNYTGPNYSIELASNPVIHKWQTDDPKAPIKGSNLSIALLNPGALPITSFYSVNDDEYMVRFYYGSQLLFIGFLVQDDCNEVMVDFRHPLQLSATDNLGLLKDIALNANPVTAILGYDNSPALRISGTAPNVITFNFGTYTPVVGVPFTVSGHPTLNGTYTATSVIINTTGYPSYSAVVGSAIPNTAFAFGVVTVQGQMNFAIKNNLLAIIQVCLYNTGLSLNTNVFANLLETRQSSANSFLQQTLIDTTTFIVNDQQYDNCYNVLSQIMERFNLSLFQANGEWNIVRWDELRYGNVPSYVYDTDMLLFGTGALPTAFTAGFNEPTYPETGLLRSITRPFKYDKETFNYKQPKYLLRNYDLQELGALIRQYTSTVYTVYEYVMPEWFSRITHPSFQFFIRVVKDNIGNEVERYVVMKGYVQVPTSFTSTRAVESTPFEVQAGDNVKLSFSTRAINLVLSGGTIDFTLRDYNGALDYVLFQDTTAPGPPPPTWHAGGVGTTGYRIPVPTNSPAWTSIEMDGPNIPFDGLMYVYLNHFNFDLAANRETHVKDIRLEYTPFVNNSTKIIGHTHKNSQLPVIKLNEDVTIQMDDSPRNSIAGTLFMPTVTSLLQDRTILWNRAGFVDNKAIGAIVTQEVLFNRRLPRTKLEGTFYQLQQAGVSISMLVPWRYTQLVGLNLTFGSLEINYRNNSIRCTMWELFADGEVDGDLINTYEFKYLYSTT